MPRVLFLTRGDEQWGLGHLHRTSWLAGFFAAQARPDLALEVHCLESAHARGFWSGCGFPVAFHPCAGTYPALELLDRIEPRPVPGDLVVVDWLDSPVELAAGLRRTGARVALLDDYGPGLGEADLVINSLLTPPEPLERTQGRARLLSGARYVQVPPDVTKLRRVAGSTTRAMQAGLDRPVPVGGTVHSVLVSFGGNPHGHATVTVLAALLVAGFKGRVVVMPAVEGLSAPDNLDLEMRPAGSDFHSVLAAVDLAVLGGGLSLYEALCLGTPALAVAIISGTPGYEGHQAGTVSRLAGAGCCVSLGGEADLDVETVAGRLAELVADQGKRASLSAAGMRLIDGGGTERTFDMLNGLLAR